MAQIFKHEADLPLSSAARPDGEAVRFGAYDLINVIGMGGMGVIWKARHRELNRIVALKMIRAGLLATVDDRKRFRAEAEAVANLDHPGIVSLHEVGECDGNQFFAMRLVEGESLGQRLKRQGPESKAFDEVAAARLITTIARAVHHAHQRGILHRDLKPANILLDREGRPHITDFGLAKQANGAADLTLSGTVMGTPNYMAPEQAVGHNRLLTTAVDIYSLGAILYELLTGRPPFQADTPLATLKQVVEREPTPPSSINRQIGQQLEIICLKCLAKEPAGRYATADDLADDLERWLKHEPIRARAVSLGERLALWSRRHPAVAALSGLALVLSLVGAAAVLWQWREAVTQRQRADENATRTEAALEQARASLWQAHFDRARAQRQTRLIGQRVKTLEAIRAAVAIRPSAELRDEAIAAFALPDFEPENNWRALPSGTVRAAMDPTLRHYAQIAGNKQISVRRLTDGSEAFQVPDELGQPDLTFSADGRFLRAESGSGVQVWNVANGRRVFALAIQPGQPLTTGMDFSPDGRWLARTEGSAMRIHNLESGRGEVVWEQTGLNRLGMCTFSPRSDRLAVRSNKEFQVWDLATKRVIARSAPPQLSAIKVAWRAPGSMLAADAADDRVLIWDTELDQQQALSGHTREVSGLWFHPSNGMLLSFSWDNTMRLWEPVAGAQLLRVGGVMPLGFSQDGKHLMVWKQSEGLGTYRVHGPSVCRLLTAGPTLPRLSSVAFSPDSKLMVAANETGVWLWRTETGERLGFGAMPRCDFADFLNASNIFSVGSSGLHLWSLTASPSGPGLTLGAPVRSSSEPKARLGSAALDVTRSRLVMHTPDVGGGVVVDLKGGQPEMALRGQSGFSAPEFSPDGRWIASGCWNPVITKQMFAAIWDAATGQMVTNIPTTKCTVTFSPDNRWLVLGANTEYQLFEAGTWKPVRTFAREEAVVDQGYSAFSPDGQLLALHATDRILRLVDPLTGKEYARLTSPDNRILKALRFSPDGRWLAAATEANVQLWDLKLLREELAALKLDW
ncbi:MAG: protein kinase domain-containing protein [Verrucomicrobiota bacterium]